MLVGFFTYKAAVVGKQAATLFGDLARGGNTPFGGSSSSSEE